MFVHSLCMLSFAAAICCCHAQLHRFSCVRCGIVCMCCILRQRGVMLYTTHVSVFADKSFCNSCAKLNQIFTSISPIPVIGLGPVNGEKSSRLIAASRKHSFIEYLIQVLSTESDHYETKPRAGWLARSSCTSMLHTRSTRYRTWNPMQKMIIHSQIYMLPIRLKALPIWLWHSAMIRCVHFQLAIVLHADTQVSCYSISRQ